MVRINNRGPGERADFEARNVIDAGFLELVRYGIRPHDPLIIDSLRLIVSEGGNPVWPRWRRYNHDGYGQRNGGPFLGLGRGAPGRS